VTTEEIAPATIEKGPAPTSATTPFRVHFMRGLLRYSVEFVVRLFFWLSVENRPKLAGAYILAPNHTSFLDPIVLQCAMHRHITFIIDAAIFRVKPFNWVYRLWNALPVTAGGSAKGALKGALHAVENGEVIGIFPEGQISKTGELLPGMAGVALLMKRAQVPVVPVAIFGAFKILPRHASFPRPGRLRVVFGEPIQPTIDADDAKEKTAEFRDRIMHAIAELQRTHAGR
jgi:1-acyl-sn-glycerol-3-phosphate acyltransferase